MEQGKYQLDQDQQVIFNQYKQIVPSTLHKQFNSLAKKYGETELLNAGYLGLVYAIKSFQDGKNCKLRTYAISNIRFFIIRRMKELDSRKNKPMSYFSINEMEDLERNCHACSGCHFTLSYDLSAIEERVDNEINIALIKDTAKRILSDRNYYIFNSLYSDGKTATQLAEEFKISTSRIHDINRRIIFQIKRNLKARGMI